ncbi:MAG: hypothetical protein K6G72_09015, partial [Lachnospiraceae bacterium]|nr:hypothetical protein [Lachnospiraceae bacterium]
MKRFEGFSLFVLKIISAAIILFLTVYAFKYTQDILPSAAEVPVDSTDLVWVNALFAVGAMFFYILFYIKEKKLSHKTKAVIEYVSLTTVVVAVTAASMWWITCEAHMPQSDQLYLFVGASHFADGDFGITSGSYFALYPHQLGLAFFLQWILKVVGPFNYLPLQYINVALALGVVVMGFVVLKIFRSRTSTIVLYCVFMILCIPLITYTQWVYGEIPSLFFMLALFIATLKYDENGKTVYAILMVLSATVACLVRKNTYVFLAAFLVVTVIKWLTSRQYKKIVLAVVVFLAPILAYRGLYAYYEHASGYEFVEMIPTSSWIEIGLEDKPELGPGWYRDVISEFKEYDMCTDEYAEVSRKKISERVHEMISDPGYAVAFYKRKALSQWNEPLY